MTSPGGTNTLNQAKCNTSNELGGNNSKWALSALRRRKDVQRFLPSNWVLRQYAYSSCPEPNVKVFDPSNSRKLMVIYLPQFESDGRVNSLA
jgi:hypothetical protein